MTREDFVFISLGLLDANAETGKTDSIEMMLPPAFFTAVNNYLLVKKSLFGTLGESTDPLFVAFDKKPITMKNALLAQLWKPIWDIMGTRLTSKDQRIVMASKMREQNLVGNTGMQHSVGTQQATYQNTRPNEGVRNKISVQGEV